MRIAFGRGDGRGEVDRNAAAGGPGGGEGLPARAGSRSGARLTAPFACMPKAPPRPPGGGSPDSWAAGYRVVSGRPDDRKSFAKMRGALPQSIELKIFSERLP